MSKSTQYILISCIVVSMLVIHPGFSKQSNDTKTESEHIQEVIEVLFRAEPNVSGEVAYACINYLVELMLIAPSIFFDVAQHHPTEFNYWIEDIQLYFWYVEEDMTSEAVVEATEHMISRLNQFTFEDQQEQYKHKVIDALRELQVRRKQLDED